MTEVPEEDVIAFVDGHLNSAARAAFEARLKIEPNLAARVASHRWMTRQVVAAYGPPPDERVDDAMIARLGLADDNVTMLADHRRRRKQQRMTWAVRISAIAASLVLGIFAGQRLPAPQGLLNTDDQGQIIAGRELADGLSNQLAGASGPVRIGISFRTDGGICRTFSTAHGVSGLGCRVGESWVVPMVATAGSPNKPTTEYQLAGGNVAPSVMAEVDHRIVGRPLSVAEERTLKADGWR